MKNKILFLLFMINNVLIAQPPQAMNYQASIIGSNGIPLANQPINIRISIIDSVSNGPILYQETFSIQTDPYGLFNILIGTGNPVSGTFNSIDWSKNNKWQKTEVDTNGGTNFSLMGISQFVSVPYALYAEKARNNIEGFGNYQNGFIIDSIYHATEDGFILARAVTVSIGCPGIPAAVLYLDTVPNPFANFAYIGSDATVTIPIKKNWYWKIVRDLNCTSYNIEIKWLPFK